MLYGILSALGLVVCWSFTPTLVKVALRFMDPYSLTFLRAVQGLTLVLAVYRLRGGRVRDLFVFDPWLIVGGIGLTTNYILFVAALNYTSAGTGGLLIQIQFVTLAVLAWVVLGERFSLIKLTGISLIVAAVVLIFAQGNAVAGILEKDYALGNSLMLVAGLGWGVYALSNKALSNRKTALELLAPVFAVAAVGALVAAVFGHEAREPLTLAGIGAVVALGTVVTGVGFLLLSRSLKVLNASLVGAITALTPLFNILISHRLLGEPLSAMLFLSAGTIVVGVVIVAQADRLTPRRNRPPKATGSSERCSRYPGSSAWPRR